MQGFLRPGQRQQTQFGVAFDADRGGTEAVVAHSADPSLNIQEQRSRLPIHKLRCGLQALPMCPATACCCLAAACSELLEF